MTIVEVHSGAPQVYTATASKTPEATSMVVSIGGGTITVFFDCSTTTSSSPTTSSPTTSSPTTSSPTTSSPTSGPFYYYGCACATNNSNGLNCGPYTYTYFYSNTKLNVHSFIKVNNKCHRIIGVDSTQGGAISVTDPQEFGDCGCGCSGYQSSTVTFSYGSQTVSDGGTLNNVPDGATINVSWGEQD